MIRKYISGLWTLIILFIGWITISLVDKKHKENDLEKRKIRLEHIHSQAINEFSISIEKFATLTAGMQSYVNLSHELPSAIELQSFLKNQLYAINYKVPIVVSYLDTNHTFIYSFTQNEINPAQLVGKSVKSIRNQEEINRLNNLMQQDSLKLFYPINLVEGWLGIPINFRVKINGNTLGYIASLVNFKPIIQSMYDPKIKEDFVFHFSTDQGNDFDREAIYDGTKIYNIKRDKEYHSNFNINSTNFLYWYVKYYGMQFKIGTAYKKPYSPDNYFLIVLYGSYISFAIFVLVLSWQINRFKNLNSEFKENYLLLENKQELILNLNKKHYQLNNQLKKLNDNKDKFFAIIGHDIKGPLNSITGLLQLLSLNDIKDSNIKLLITNLSNATKNTVDLLNNLLKWARSQAGDMEFNPTEIHINSILNDSINTLKQQADDKQINIVTHLKKDFTIIGDADMISAVIRNIISNAIKFTKIKGEIIIKSEEIDGSASIKIEDNGIGMREAEMNKLFTLERHMSTKGTEGEIGTGLGLLLCYEFVKKHRGKIEVKSKLNKGTVFTITLPKNIE